MGIHQPIENDTSGGGGEAPTAKVPHSDLGYEVAISLDTPLTFLPDESSSEEETVATWRHHEIFVLSPLLIPNSIMFDFIYWLVLISVRSQFEYIQFDQVRIYPSEQSTPLYIHL